MDKCYLQGRTSKKNKISKKKIYLWYYIFTVDSLFPFSAQMSLELSYFMLILVTNLFKYYSI